MITGIPNKKRGVERLAGITALLITFLVVSAILTALDIKPDHINIHDDLSYLGDNIDRLWLNSMIWFVASVLIVMLGPLILMSFLPYGRSSAYLAAFLISTTGIVYIIISINGLNMISMVSVYQESSGQETDYIASLSYFMLVSRSNLQLAAYTLVGISSIILGLLIASSGLLPRFIGWVAIFGGLIYASFGWIGMDHILFMVGRLLFLLALIILGSFLLLRGTRKKTEK
ncbi:MAG: hypothetical protein AMS23_08125 [Bacteroides sp. SM1_62]|jgi:hypothetical protein|nr:MAG: hypothetical protein AMS26_15575 [Bacteroides sp. SM23_62]KPL22292.1 MAG: hypothetical protein AMS23_08125 [Bacteroides sp. SM1_62]